MKFSIAKSASKTKSPSAAASGPPARPARGAVSLKGVAVSVFLVTMLLLLLPPAAVYWFGIQSLQQSDQREAQVAAEHFADRMQGWVAEQEHTAELAAKDVALSRLLESGDHAAWADKEAELALLFPDSVRVRLIGPRD